MPAIVIIKRKNYDIYWPVAKGRTSAFQVRKDGIIVKKFRFTVNDRVSRENAMNDARELFVDLVGQNEKAE